jgi:hypothetical protein
MSAPADEGPAAAPRFTPLESVLLAVAPQLDRGDFAQVDSALGVFALRQDGSCMAAESNYLRAVLRMSAPAQASRISEAVALLDGYLSSTCPTDSRAAEATFLRKLAVNSAQRATAADSVAAEEIRKLREQLDQTKRDVERLKMRIIPPPGRRAP